MQSTFLSRPNRGSSKARKPKKREEADVKNTRSSAYPHALSMLVVLNSFQDGKVLDLKKSGQSHNPFKVPDNEKIYIC